LDALDRAAAFNTAALEIQDTHFEPSALDRAACLERAAGDGDQIGIGPRTGRLGIAGSHELFLRRREVSAELALAELNIVFALIVVAENQRLGAMTDAFDYVNGGVITAVAVSAKRIAHSYIPSYSVLATTSS
jgi:hypothetical protein